MSFPEKAIEITCHPPFGYVMTCRRALWLLPLKVNFVLSSEKRMISFFQCTNSVETICEKVMHIPSEFLEHDMASPAGDGVLTGTYRFWTR